MDVCSLEKIVVCDHWEDTDLRSYKADLLYLAQKGLGHFMPLRRDQYKDNAIQILDFFSGAGGTSLGFASINSVIPAFEFLGGCDINRVSAETYAHNFDTPIINQDIIDLADDDLEHLAELVRV